MSISVSAYRHRHRCRHRCRTVSVSVPRFGGAKICLYPDIVEDVNGVKSKQWFTHRIIISFPAGASAARLSCVHLTMWLTCCGSKRNHQAHQRLEEGERPKRHGVFKWAMSKKPAPQPAPPPPSQLTPCDSIAFSPFFFGDPCLYPVAA